MDIIPVALSENLNSEAPNDIINKIFKHKKYGEYKVIKKTNNKKNNIQTYKIKFLLTGFSYELRKDKIINGNVKDNLFKSVLGIGYLKNKKIVEKNKKIYIVWRNMLSRCYNEKNISYKYYGKKGITVCKEWFCFDTFLKDITNIDGWDETKFNLKQLALDKDIKQKNILKNKVIYSKNTCMWVSKTQNSIVAVDYLMNNFYMKNLYTGIGKIHNNASEIARELEVNAGTINGFIKSGGGLIKRGKLKGWIFFKLDKNNHGRISEKNAYYTFISPENICFDKQISINCFCKANNLSISKFQKGIASGKNLIDGWKIIKNDIEEIV